MTQVTLIDKMGSDLSVVNSARVSFAKQHNTMQDNDKVFVFNDWTFASSPSIRPFDHPVYDVWLKKCYS